MKATSEELSLAYAQEGSIYRVAKRFGMCPQSVQERLAKLGVKRNGNPFSEEEKKDIRMLYERGFIRGDGQVQALAKALGRTVGTIYTFACSEGLCNSRRPVEKSLISHMVEKSKEAIKRAKEAGTYRNAMQGIRCTAARRKQMSEHSTKVWSRVSKEEVNRRVMKAQKTRVAKYGRVGNATRPGETTWKAGWRDIGGQRIYARSRWEANYARYLEFLRERGYVVIWEHEPETFWFPTIKRGCCSYLPDFRVLLPGGKVEYHEVKGWMDAKSKTKIARMAKFHPKVVLQVIDAKRYRALARQLSSVIKGWESDTRRAE